MGEGGTDGEKARISEVARIVNIVSKDKGGAGAVAEIRFVFDPIPSDTTRYADADRGRVEETGPIDVVNAMTTRAVNADSPRSCIDESARRPVTDYTPVSQREGSTQGNPACVGKRTVYNNPVSAPVHLNLSGVCK